MDYWGSGWSERLDGSNYADRLYGYGGNDLLVGWGGNDRLFGGTGSDSLYGGTGEDLLHGGAGRDYLVGGSGADAFVFDSRANYGSEPDQIADFSGRDMIAIDNDYFPNLGRDGWMAAWMFKTVGNGGSVDANDRLIYNARTGVLTYDWNGSADGGQVTLAQLNGAPWLEAADIYIL